MEKVKFDLPLLLPDIDERDSCVTLLTDWLTPIKGIEHVHIVKENGTSRLCLHYDPNLVTLGRVQRLAQEAGFGVSNRYRHEQIAIAHLTSADAADLITDTLTALPGMLHSHANYAAGIVSVAYDSTELSRDTIEQALHSLGVGLAAPAAPPAHGEEHGDHDHGSAPAFLPHWMQERWTLLLVGAAGIFFLIGWLGELLFNLSPTIALVLFILSYIAGGYDIATHAIPGLLKRKFDTDILMLAAAAGAAILGEWAEGAFLLFLFSLGHAGEHYALDRARNAVNALGELMPQTARLKQGDRIVEVPVSSLRVDNVVVVRPGDRLPVDGRIVLGESAIDQSPITGESVPVEKGVGDDVFAGTINQNAALEIQVTKLAADNTLSRVMKMVAEAQSQQSPTQQFTSRFTSIFVPAVLGFVALVAVVPPLVGWMPFSESFYRAMLLLVAASPCALAIGTPATVLAGIAQAAKNGVLIKGGVYLEKLGSLNVMAFDKTGTLTQGKFTVTDIVPLNGHNADAALKIAAAVEQQSNHPLAEAVVDAANDKNLSLPVADGLENIAGRGVQSTVDGQSVWIGSLKLFQDAGNTALVALVSETVAELEMQGKTTMVVSLNDEPMGVLALADVPRPGIRQTLAKLKQAGIVRLVMLTGDNQTVAQEIAREVGVTDVRAELLPENKLDAIKSLQAEYTDVAMVGDGVNDAPALATATVGIAMGGAGTAVALETADVALMADDLSKLPFAVGLSKASRAIIKQNLAFSLGIIGILLVTSVLGIVPLSGTVALHEGSTLVVVLNALRLLKFKA